MKNDYFLNIALLIATGSLIFQTAVLFVNPNEDKIAVFCWNFASLVAIIMYNKKGK